MKFSDYTTDNLLMVLWIICLTSFCVQLFYYLYFYSRLSFSHRTRKPEPAQTPVSVILCAKNQAENLKLFLPAVLSQKYPVFEVLVVNDSSDDQTESVLEYFAAQHKHLRYFSVKQEPENFKGKKFALDFGIRQSKHPVLLLTDADCYPVGDQWIGKMTAPLHGKTEIVLGYSGYEKRRGFLNKIIRFDTFFTGMQYLTFANAGFPYMGVGRNMAYIKELFIKSNGFNSHAHLISGDDDLFINQVANRNNTISECEPVSFTKSVPKTTFSDWVLQKKRHFSTWKLYKSVNKILLGGEIISRVLFYFTAASLLFMSPVIIWVLIVILIRMLVQGLVFKNALRRLCEEDLLLSSLLLDLMIPFLNLGITVRYMFSSRQNKWN